MNVSYRVYMRHQIKTDQTKITAVLAKDEDDAKRKAKNAWKNYQPIRVIKI